MEYLMGIDLGSTNIKSIVFDQNGNIINRSSKETPIEYQKKGHEEWVFYRPEKVWENVQYTIANAANAVGGRISSIAVTGMGMDSVPLDGHGDSLYPFISWRCPRGHDIFQNTVEKFGLGRIYEMTGQLPRYLNSVIRYLWLKENEPHLFNQTEKWLTIEDFVNYKLSGAMATDYSMASTTLLCGIDKKWNEELLDFFGIERRMLPEILPGTTFLGKIKEDVAEITGLDKSTVIVLGGHDYHCGSVSCGGFDETKLVMSIGTYECNITSPMKANPTPDTFSRGLSYEGHVIPDKFSLAVGMIEGGVLDWWKSNFEAFCLTDKNTASVQEIWNAIMRQVTGLPPRTNMPYFMPHLYGCDSPEKDPESKGAFVGITASVSKADMLYALIEGINFQSVSLVYNMEKEINSEFKTIHAIGSITTNNYIMQQKADILGRSIFVDPKNTEAVCLGAAMLGGVGARVYSSIFDSYACLKNELLEVRPDRKMYDFYAERFRIFKQIYPSLASLHRLIPYS